MMKDKIRMLISAGCITLLSYFNIFGKFGTFEQYLKHDDLYHPPSVSIPKLKDDNERNPISNKISSEADSIIVEELEANTTKQIKELHERIVNMSLRIEDLERKSVQQMTEQKAVLQNLTHHIRSFEKVYSNSNNTVQNTKPILFDNRVLQSNVNKRPTKNLFDEVARHDYEDEMKITKQLLSDCCNFPNLHNEDKERITNNSMIKTIEIVVAYCQSDLTWMYEKILDQIEKVSNQLEIKITILSKCGKEDTLVENNFAGDHRVVNYTVIQLPNVGGCDYAYAYFLDEYIKKYSLSAEKKEEEAAAESTLFLFIKDTPRISKNLRISSHDHYRPIDEMMQLAMSSGNFVCGIKPKCSPNYSHTEYHDTKLLGKFNMHNYVRVTTMREQGPQNQNNKAEFNQLNYRNLADFHFRGLSNYSFPNNEVVKVCYGGTFAVPAARVINISKDPRSRYVFRLLKYRLSRHTINGVALEEHFAERTWAGMLSLPASEVETRLVKQIWPYPIQWVNHRSGVLRNGVGGSIC